MQITQEQVDEFNRCKEDIVYFAENYIKHMTIDGIKQLKLYPYQIEVLTDDRLTASTSRQIGFTLISYVKIIHSLIFNYDRTIVFYTIKRDRFAHSLQTIAAMLDMCEFPFKPEFTTRNKGQLVLDNGMRVLGASSSHHVRGFAVSELYMEEVDYYQDNIEELMYHILPTILCSKNVKFWVWSTEQNGNLQKIKKYVGDTFKHYHLPWYVIPNRTSDWKNQQINNLSETIFNHEFNAKMT
jgi:hypothetical protein